MHPGFVFHRRLGVTLYEALTSQVFWRDHVASILDHAGPGSRERPPRLLDLGCGPGASVFVLAERLGPRAEIVAVDVSPAMVERARHLHETRYPHLGNVRFEIEDATALSLPDASFDLVVGHSFLYLTTDRRAVLTEVARVLRPGGRLLLMEPNREGSLWRAAAGLGRRHIAAALRRPIAAGRFAASMVTWRLFGRAARWPRAKELAALLAEAGFEEIAIHPTLGGLGLHCVAARGPAGRRPPSPELDSASPPANPRQIAGCSAKGEPE